MVCAKPLPSLQRRLFVLSLILLITSGCGSRDDRWTKARPKRVPVTGEVFYQGKPLADAFVTFTNEEAARSATGTTDSDGKFVLGTFEIDDGAVPGPQTVTISKTALDFPQGGLVGLSREELNARLSTMSEQEQLKLGPSQARWLIPERYGNAEQSGLTAEVIDGQENHFRFELTD